MVFQLYGGHCDMISILAEIAEKTRLRVAKAKEAVPFEQVRKQAF